MLVKCSCSGATYEIVRRKMLRALIEFRIRGVKTNIPFLLALLTNETFVKGDCWTTFIDDTPKLFEMMTSRNRGQNCWPISLTSQSMGLKLLASVEPRT